MSLNFAGVLMFFGIGLVILAFTLVFSRLLQALLYERHDQTHEAHAEEDQNSRKADKHRSTPLPDEMSTGTRFT